MLPSSLKLSRAATATVARTVQLGLASFKPSSSSPYRLIHDGIIKGPNVNPVALQMIDYALSLAKSKKSDESNAQAMLVLEQCLSSQSSESQDVVTHNSKGMVLLAMSSLLSARGNYDDAMEKLQNIQVLVHSHLDVRVAAMEALTGINLEMGNDDTSSVLADKCLELLGKVDLKNSDEGSEIAIARAKAIKGLTKLVQGNLESAEPFFQGFLDNKGCIGNAALSYGEFLHATRNFSLAKDIYQKVIQEVAKKKDFTDVHALAACNMASEEVLLAATCSLGQLEVHMGNFGNAEETLTTALNRAEQLFGSRHPKVGVVLTCMALMFQHKAKQEHSSSLLIQEGLYRRAIDLLKAPPLDLEVNRTMRSRMDIIALARGGYAETLCIQENRKREGEKMKRWAEDAWRNRSLSLSEALKISDSSNRMPVVDARIVRAL
uniref:MalT-like TPR region domain-containing protein n=2 Tax=Salix viminalis TaxID=40686 RepID=A0A6N2MIL7_SALVM